MKKCNLQLQIKRCNNITRAENDLFTILAVSVPRAPNTVAVAPKSIIMYVRRDT